MNQLSTWLQWLFPPSCAFCHALSAQVCCAACAKSLHVYPHACCSRCGFLLSESLSPGPCGQCIAYAPPQQQSQSLYCYEDAVRQAILHWKLQGEDAAMAHLLQLARPRLCQLFKKDDLLLPVPAPLARMRQSGVHHSANLCQKICSFTQSQWDWRLLRRVGVQARQSELSGKERRKNLRKAFVLSDRNLPASIARIWVVDDVMTTGSTLHYAAKVARKYQKEVGVFSLARVMLR